MLQWLIFNTNITETYQGVDKVNYVNREACCSDIGILLMGFIQRMDRTLIGLEMWWTYEKILFRKGNLKIIYNLMDGCIWVGGRLFA